VTRSPGTGLEKARGLSLPMRFLLKLGFERTAWALRRLYCPVGPDDLVLEVGSGGNPYFRANVLVDAYENTAERHWVPLVADRPMVMAFGEDLPFIDKAFDFVIASHVLEHSTDPARFLGELQRVAKAGYIEVPDAFMERINPYRDHRLEITVREGVLKIRRKNGPVVDHELVELYEDSAKFWVTRELIPRHPFSFHVRLYWRDHIDFEISGEEGSEAEVPDNRPLAAPVKGTLRARFQQGVLGLVRRLFSQSARNSAIDVASLLRCTRCHAPKLIRNEGKLCCPDCKARFAVRNGIHDLSSAII
jgi:SAM-dependent methyltransferase